MKTSGSYIMQQLFNPHANGANATHTKLKAKLALKKTSLPFTKNVMSPEGMVYQISSDMENEAAFLASSLQQLNFTQGGDCENPTTTLFNQSTCLDHNSTDPQVWNTSLSFDACNNTSTAISSLLLQTLIDFCAASSSGEEDIPIETYLAISYLIMGGGILAGVLIGCLIMHNDERREIEDGYRYHRLAF